MDRIRVLKQGPWCFQNALIILVESVGIGDMSKLDFSHISL